MKRLIYIVAIFFTGVWLTSCRSIKYVPVETVKHDSIHINHIKYDSVYYAEKGDTIYLYKYKYGDRDKIIRDTVRIFKQDTIRIAYPVEKPLTKWQSVKLDIGEITIELCIAFIIFIIGWIIYKRR